MEMYRQGDLLFIKAESISNDSLEVNNKIIIESNITGHSHRISSGKLFKRNLLRFDEENRWDDLNSKGVIGFIESDGNTKILHDEHNSIELPNGIFEIRRQKEVGGFVND